MNELFMAYDRWGGLVTILGGIYFSLLAYGYLPRNPKDPEKMLEWRRRFGSMMQVLAPLVILGGVITLAIGLSSTPVNPADKRVFAEFYRANEARITRGVSPQSAELFVADLRKIDLGKASPDFRAAVQDYIDATAEGIAALKAGKSVAAATEKMTDAKRRLEAVESTIRR